MKDLLGYKSTTENEDRRDILQRLHTVVSAGEEIIVDLRRNNGNKPKSEEFWIIVDERISEKTAVDDRRHVADDSNETGGVVVNMALSLSYADMYRTCVKIAQERNINIVPSYAWFILQFWPTNKSTSKLLHYTGRFRARRVVHSRILRKANPNAQYARPLYNFLKTRAIKYRTITIIILLCLRL